MQRHFELELDELKQKLLAMASHAESSIRTAVRALTERNDDLAAEAVEQDTIIDQFEMEIDDVAVRLLALQAPVASDLRLITTGMRIGHDLERVGDEATTIARRALELNAEPQLKPYVDIPRMASLGLEMLKESLDAFVMRAPDRARAVIPRDKEVDAINKQLHRELASFMVEDPKTISRALNLMVVSKSLERIADHAKNIAEEVVYIYEARDIRHGRDHG